MPYASITNF